MIYFIFHLKEEKIKIMISIILGVVVFVILCFVDEELIAPGFFIGLGVFFICLLGASVWTPDEVTYTEEPVEFQEIEGELFIPQGNSYVVKIDGNISVKPKALFHTVQSDSVYNEVQIGRKVVLHENVQRWIPGKQVNDTTYYVNKYILYRNLN